MPYINPETMRDMLSESLDIFLKKNKAYGNSFENSINKHGTIAAIVRMEDKMDRLFTLIKNPDIFSFDESVIDTATDLGNYALMLACYLKGARDEQARNEPTKYPGGLEGHVDYRPRFQPRDSAIECGGTTSISVAPANHGGVGTDVSSVPPARR